MTYDERTVVHRDETDAPASATTDRSTAVTSRTVEMRPSGGTVAGRIVIFIFGVIQALILLRIRPYNEPAWRHLVFNVRTKEVMRLDGIEQACRRLPDDPPAGIWPS